MRERPHRRTNLSGRGLFPCRTCRSGVSGGALDRPGSDGGFLASRRSVSPARTGQGALQRGKIVRLLQHLETAAHRVLAARTIARGEQHRDFWKLTAHAIGKLKSVHAARHQYVREDDVDVGLPLEHVKARLGTGSKTNFVAELFEIDTADFGNLHVVF